jgi:hypothetical protein
MNKNKRRYNSPIGNWAKNIQHDLRLMAPVVYEVVAFYSLLHVVYVFVVMGA